MSYRIVSALLFGVLCASGVLTARPAGGGPPESIEHMRSELNKRSDKLTLSPFGCRME